MVNFLFVAVIIFFSDPGIGADQEHSEGARAHGVLDLSCRHREFQKSGGEVSIHGDLSPFPERSPSLVPVIPPFRGSVSSFLTCTNVRSGDFIGIRGELGSAMDLEGYVRRLHAAGVPVNEVIVSLARSVEEWKDVPRSTRASLRRP